MEVCQFNMCFMFEKGEFTFAFAHIQVPLSHQLLDRGELKLKVKVKATVLVLKVLQICSVRNKYHSHIQMSNFFQYQL